MLSMVAAGNVLPVSQLGCDGCHKRMCNSAVRSSDDIPLRHQIPLLLASILREEPVQRCRHLVLFITFRGNYRVLACPAWAGRNMLTVNQQIRAAQTGKPKLYEFTVHARILSQKIPYVPCEKDR